MRDNSDPSAKDLIALNVHQSGLSDAEKQAFDEAERLERTGTVDLKGKTVREIVDQQLARDTQT